MTSPEAPLLQQTNTLKNAVDESLLTPAQEQARDTIVDTERTVRRSSICTAHAMQVRHSSAGYSKKRRHGLITRPFINSQIIRL